MMRLSTWVLLAIAGLMLAGGGLVLADRDGYDDDRGERGFFSRWMMPQRMAYNTQYSQLYQEECGSCHFPFQPGFLPASSWQAMMQGLDDHFGENAELSDENNQRITEFLLANAAGEVNREIPNKVKWSLRFTPEPQRITETAFFRHEHREVPPRILQQAENKLSFANCDNCHTRALQGSYNEHEIRIPGIGRWDD
jgi:hypothetical protein